MTLANFALLVAIFGFGANGQEVAHELVCHGSGECQNSVALDYERVTSYAGCMSHCRNHDGCEWATYYPDGRVSNQTIYQNPSYSMISDVSIDVWSLLWMSPLQ